ncbi:MAG: hypothetical protein RI560_12520, partial [Natronomonas sp.]|nr:hypothetical protein [Natronomonas sp.]
MVIDIEADEWFVVLGAPDTPAGDYQLDNGLGTVAEWYDVDAETRVIVAASIDEANEKPLHVESVDDLVEAVEGGRLMLRALPAPLLVPALDE